MSSFSCTDEKQFYVESCLKLLEGGGDGVAGLIGDLDNTYISYREGLVKEMLPEPLKPLNQDQQDQADQINCERLKVKYLDQKPVISQLPQKLDQQNIIQKGMKVQEGSMNYNDFNANQKFHIRDKNDYERNIQCYQNLTRNQTNSYKYYLDNNYEQLLRKDNPQQLVRENKQNKKMFYPGQLIENRTRILKMMDPHQIQDMEQKKIEEIDQMGGLQDNVTNLKNNGLLKETINLDFKKEQFYDLNNPQNLKADMRLYQQKIERYQMLMDMQNGKTKKDESLQDLVEQFNRLDMSEDQDHDPFNYNPYKNNKVVHMSWRN